jgi:hypothetical protein
VKAPMARRYNQYTAPPLAERLWSHVDRGSDAECWNWRDSVNRWGYGKVIDGGVRLTSSRAAWTVTFGPIPDSKWVLHTCDNPRCCNPKHLYLGTVLENNRDMIARGRRPYSPGKAHLTECPNGHAYSRDNTRIVTKDGKPGRQCIACAKAHATANWEKRKALAQYLGVSTHAVRHHSIARVRLRRLARGGR